MESIYFALDNFMDEFTPSFSAIVDGKSLINFYL